MVGCNPPGRVKGLWKGLMSFCKANEHEGFKVFCKGGISGTEGLGYVLLVHGIKWRYMWLEKIGTCALSGFLSWFWAPLRRVGVAQKLEKLFQRKVSAPLGPDDNVGTDLTPPTSHWNLEPFSTPKAVLSWRVWKQCPLRSLCWQQGSLSRSFLRTE